jgi:hypothetical protein
MPVALPVETKLPQLAHAAGAINRQADIIRLVATFFIIFSKLVFVRILTLPL